MGDDERMSTDFRQTLTTPVCEKTASTITFQLTDQADVALALASLTTLTLTLYDVVAPTAFFNSRNAQDILGVNGGSVSAGGVLTLVLGNADNVLTSQNNTEETHAALLRWTWSSGTRQGAKELLYSIVNQVQIT